MSELKVFVKAGEPDRLVDVETPSAVVHAEFDGYRLAEAEKDDAPEPEHAARRGRKASE